MVPELSVGLDPPYSAHGSFAGRPSISEVEALAEIGASPKMIKPPQRPLSVSSRFEPFL